MLNILSLVWADMKVHWVRMLLTVIGVGAATGAVVWTYGSYATKRAQASAHASAILGRYTHWVTCSNPDIGRRQPRIAPKSMEISEAVHKGISSDPRVTEFNPVYQDSVQVLSRDAKRSMKRRGPPFRPLIAATTSPNPPCDYGKITGSWINIFVTDSDEAVVLETVAATLDVKMGENVYFAGPAGEISAKVTGIIPCALARWDMPNGFPAVYITPTTMRKIHGKVDEKLPVNAIYLRVKNPSDCEPFTSTWKPKTEAEQVFLCDENDLRQKLAGAGSPYDVQGLYIVALAFLGSLFVIFTTLNIGFGEKARQFAMLRVVGMYRTGVACMIFVEGLIVGLVGFLVSLPVGWLILRITVAMKPQLFPNGVSLDGTAIGLALAASISGSLLASILPAWLSLRLKPLSAVTQQTATYSAKSRAWLAIIGLLFLLPSQLAIYAFEMEPDTRVRLFGIMGLPTLAIGVLLLIPTIMFFVEKAIAPFLANILGLPGELSIHELSRNTWRSMGVIISITIGLGLFIAMKTWGYTMLKPYQPTGAVPDLIASFKPDGLPSDQVQKVIAAEGINPERCLPLVIRQPYLGRAALEKMDRKWGTSDSKDPHGGAMRKPNVILVGMDTQKALGAVDPVLRFEFIGASRIEMANKMKNGGYCIIPLSLASLADVKVGDRLPISHLQARNTPRGMDGKHVANTGQGHKRRIGRGGMTRRETGRSNPGSTDSGDTIRSSKDDQDRMVAGDMRSVRNSRSRDSMRGRARNSDGTPAIYHIALIKQQKETESEFIVAGIYTEPWHLLTGWTGMRGLDGTSFACNGLVIVNSDDARIIPGSNRTVFFWANMNEQYRTMKPIDSGTKVRGELELVASTQSGHSYVPFGEKEPISVKIPQVNVITRDFLIQNCLSHANDIINRMSQLPMFALLISSLAVANTIMASVRSRKWELGILRSLGLTRGKLLRLLVAESLLIAITATIASLTFGVLSGGSVAVIAGYSQWTKGMPIEMVIPWGHIATGIVLTFGITIAATVWPAITTARREPLKLLSEGRSAV